MPTTRPYSLCGIALLTFCAVAPSFAASIKLELATIDVLHDRLAAGRVSQKMRQKDIHGLFEKAGCAVTEDQVNKRAANVICTLPGQQPGTIVVGGHYDFVPQGDGIVDDWSGTAMLVSLFETLQKVPRTHTYKFIAFAKEEDGLIGSRHYVQQLSPDERKDIRAFVNLECLGLAGPEVWTARSDPKLLRLLVDAANASHVEVKGMNADRVGDDDSHPFLDKKIPVLTLHSLTQETLGTIHSHEDRLDAIDMKRYFAAYRLTAFFLVYLDANLE